MGNRTVVVAVLTGLSIVEHSRVHNEVRGFEQPPMMTRRINVDSGSAAQSTGIMTLPGFTLNYVG